jgi:glycosyltransferase involved in cell wall biosynthesis
MGGEGLDTMVKGQDLLVRAWLLAGLGQRGCQLHFLGDGALRPALQRLARGESSIRFHGVVADVTEWLLAADCFVMPSRIEGLPLAGIEAAGAGLPCIFSDIAPLRELDPPLALWAAPGDVDALAGCLLALAVQVPAPAADLCLAFRQRFSMAQVAENYRLLYRDTAALQL